MSSEKMFRKKTRDGETDGSQDLTSQPEQVEDMVTEESDNKVGGSKRKQTAPSPKNFSKDLDPDDGTIRLSCDLPRRLHTSLRVAAALSERSILGMIETLIIQHLADKPADEIVAAYHKTNDIKVTRIK